MHKEAYTGNNVLVPQYSDAICTVYQTVKILPVHSVFSHAHSNPQVSSHAFTSVTMIGFPQHSRPCFARGLKSINQCEIRNHVNHSDIYHGVTTTKS